MIISRTQYLSILSFLTMRSFLLSLFSSYCITALMYGYPFRLSNSWHNIRTLEHVENVTLKLEIWYGFYNTHEAWQQAPYRRNQT